jgi:hypothetical protein
MTHLDMRTMLIYGMVLISMITPSLIAFGLAISVYLLWESIALVWRRFWLSGVHMREALRWYRAQHGTSMRIVARSSLIMDLTIAITALVIYHHQDTTMASAWPIWIGKASMIHATILMLMTMKMMSVHGHYRRIVTTVPVNTLLP